MEETLIKEIRSVLLSEREGQGVLYLASGGSSIPISVAVLNGVPMELRAHITLTLTDERYGKVGHADSNWQQLLSAGLDLAGFTAVPVLIDDNKSKEETTELFAKHLNSAIANAKKIVALFGMGADEHIAGILPKSPATRAIDSSAVVYDAGTYQRITLTPPIFHKITDAFVYTKGDAKQFAVQNLSNDLSFVEHPNQLLKWCGRYFVTHVQ